ncbi:MAG: ankyrin repeat domain-containing protein, partial [Verrucomicrobiota bacterium]|nr:ankyrin repeat domain-containing protein [Verrucomicrobiota bacterium]MEE2948372.1 ankyrin repeat domain-containing protein [Verrucomicrobiota bacterium]
MKHLLLTTIAAVVLVGCGPDIHEAVEAGNIEAVKQAIAAGKDVNSEDECCGATPLHYATRWGRKEIAELLIAKGADVNAKAKYGDTPLHGAIYANGTYL